MPAKTLVITVVPDDGGFVDSAHFEVLVEFAAKDDLTLTETNRRLKNCSRPATAYRGIPAEA